MRKWLLIGVVVFVALAAAGVYCNARQGVWLDGAFYAQTSEGTFAAGGDRIAIETQQNRAPAPPPLGWDAQRPPWEGPAGPGRGYGPPL